MADLKISELTALAGANLATGDVSGQLDVVVVSSINPTEGQLNCV